MNGKSQNNLIERERLAAVDEIIVTINHKINNPLSTIVNYAEILKQMMQKSDNYKAEENLKTIINAAMQIKKIISQLSIIESTNTIPYLPDISMINLPED
jgi:C4-dicarboxylate-specific signal transduction histidine kinase